MAWAEALELSSVSICRVTPLMMAVNAAGAITQVKGIMIALARLYYFTSSPKASPVIGSGPSPMIKNMGFETK